MVAAIRMTCSLLKLRIGAAVAASALAGMAAANGPAISVAQASALALAVLGASGAAGAFNHYYERDLDREMNPRFWTFLHSLYARARAGLTA
jgi:protoheme IX farnesyltransferase